HARRQLQRDEEDRGGERVAAAPDVAELVDQVEEREQHDERAEDQQDRRENLSADVAGQRLHAGAALGALSRRSTPKSLSSRPKSSSTTPIAIACGSRSPVPNA